MTSELKWRSENLLKKVENASSPRRVGMVVMGRGIHIQATPDLKNNSPEAEALMARLGSGEDLHLLEPTDVLEDAVIKDLTKPTLGPEEHPSIGWKVELGSEPQSSRYAGGQLNVDAAAIVADELVVGGQKLEKIYFAAGRTPELNFLPQDVSQGSVMAKAFLSKATDGVKDSQAVIALEPENLNTLDDIAGSLKNAAESGLTDVIFITVGVHIPRTRFEVNEALVGIGRLMGEDRVPRVHFLSSEAVLRGSEQWLKVNQIVRKSIGFKETLRREQKGVRRRRQPDYAPKWDKPEAIQNFNKPVVNMRMADFGSSS